MTLVERIAKLCSEQGTTMTAIERENGLAVSSIRKWDDHAPTIPKLVIVAKALNTTVSYLIGETDIKNPAPISEGGFVYFLSAAALAITAHSSRVTKSRGRFPSVSPIFFASSRSSGIVAGCPASSAR